VPEADARLLRGHAELIERVDGLVDAIVEELKLLGVDLNRVHDVYPLIHQQWVLFRSADEP